MSGMTKSVFGQLRKKADEASYNESVTRKRVTILEERAQEVELGLGAVYRVIGRPFWGRVKWLFTGK